MAQRIHYTQNCLYLFNQIRAIDDALDLKLNGELFFEKILEDIFFIEQKLDINFDSLKENTNLIRRIEHFRAVMNTKLGFIHLMERILGLPIEHYFEVHPFRTRFEQAIIKHQKDVSDIRNLVVTDYSEPEDEDLVSETEINMLLQTPDDFDE